MPPPTSCCSSARLLFASTLGVLVTLIISQWKSLAAPASKMDVYYYPLMAVGWIALLLLGGGYCIFVYPPPQERAFPRFSEPSDSSPTSSLMNEQWFRRNASGQEVRFTGRPASQTKCKTRPKDDLASFYREMANTGRR